MVKIIKKKHSTLKQKVLFLYDVYRRQIRTYMLAFV